MKIQENVVLIMLPLDVGYGFGAGDCTQICHDPISLTSRDSIRDNWQMSADIPDVDVSIDGPAVDKMNPRADAAEFTELEMCFHRSKPYRICGSGNWKDARRAVNAHSRGSLTLREPLPANRPKTLRRVLEILLQAVLALSLFACPNVVGKAEQ